MITYAIDKEGESYMKKENFKDVDSLTYEREPMVSSLKDIKFPNVADRGSIVIPNGKPYFTIGEFAEYLFIPVANVLQLLEQCGYSFKNMSYEPLYGALIIRRGMVMDEIEEIGELEYYSPTTFKKCVGTILDIASWLKLPVLDLLDAYHTYEDIDDAIRVTQGRLSGTKSLERYMGIVPIDDEDDSYLLEKKRMWTNQKMESPKMRFRNVNDYLKLLLTDYNSIYLNNLTKEQLAAIRKQISQVSKQRMLSAQDAQELRSWITTRNLTREQNAELFHYLQDSPQNFDRKGNNKVYYLK